MVTSCRAYGIYLTPLPSLDELVRDGVNGLVFKDASQLAEQFTVG